MLWSMCMPSMYGSKIFTSYTHVYSILLWSCCCFYIAAKVIKFFVHDNKIFKVSICDISNDNYSYVMLRSMSLLCMVLRYLLLIHMFTPSSLLMNYCRLAASNFVSLLCSEFSYLITCYNRCCFLSIAFDSVMWKCHIPRTWPFVCFYLIGSFVFFQCRIIKCWALIITHCRTLWDPVDLL